MINEIGNRYGRLTVVRYDHTSKTRGVYWFCVCDCGCTTVANGNRMRSGRVKSCGCLKKETQESLGERTRETSSERMKDFNQSFWTEEHRQQNREKAMVHGGTGTRLYAIWQGMRERCTGNDKDHAKYYRDKGIRVCKEWESFETFREWSIEHGYQEQDADTPLKDRMSIDRIDPTKGYSPDNCQWITFSENSLRRNQCHADQR